MEKRRWYSVLCFVAPFGFWASANALLSPKGVNFEVQALMGIRDSLDDPHGVLENWDVNAVDPCSWTMVNCSADKLVIGLGTPSQNLSGSLSPSIGNLTNLQIVLLQNNNVSGPIPTELGRLPKLQTLDLSNNFFTGEIPSSLAHLKSLQYLRLNNNSLSRSIPFSLANMTQLAFLDLLYSNLNGPVPRTEKDCNGTTAMPLSCPLNNAQSSQPLGKPKGHKFALAFRSSLGCICLLAFGFGFLLWWRQKRHQQIFFDVNVCLGNLKRFQFRELQSATKKFSSKSIIGKGGFGNVYKGYLQDGTVVAVKRLKDGNAVVGEIQFQTEVEMISLAVHCNLLRLYGFCMTSSERLLVYPYLSNGSVALRLKDVKAANTLLDDYYEAVVGDFGLAKLLDHQDSHVTTAVKKIHQEKKLDALVNKDLKNNYDRIGLEEMVQVALLCTQYLPSHRPKMSEVVRMLEGDGLAEKWDASQRVDTTRCRANEFSSSERYSDLTDDSSLLIQAMELSGPW
ncbi:hypothetical protein TEA_007397 [Camellia sinensis var. sinensis]|uniref:Protein kinase domain-containing protein n=1 Tax=Camellia sinensis var. sinensis TaxID=542762 RepID=A0A4S4EBR9_CAMSN|nr:hypothetical protein TEA_007397 [Camellia sinensis var. sinensis]